MRKIPLKRWAKSYGVPLVAGAVLLGAIAAMQSSRHNQLRQLEEGEYKFAYLPNVTSAPLLFAGHKSTASKLFWIRGAIYFGDGSLRGTATPSMLHLVDLITTLDPHHKWSYQMAGTSLRTDDDRDLTILKRGIQTYPDDWMINFLYVLRLVEKKQDYATAATIMERFKDDLEAPLFVREVHKTYQTNQNAMPQAIMIYLGEYLDPAKKFYKPAIKQRLVYMMVKRLKIRESSVEKEIREVIDQLDSNRIDPSAAYRTLLQIEERERLSLLE